MVMDYAVQYCNESTEITNITIALRNINYARLYKRMFLPFELVGINSGTFTNVFRNIEEYSIIK